MISYITDCSKALLRILLSAFACFGVGCSTLFTFWERAAHSVYSMLIFVVFSPIVILVISHFGSDCNSSWGNPLMSFDGKKLVAANQIDKFSIHFDRRYLFVAGIFYYKKVIEKQ